MLIFFISFVSSARFLEKISRVRRLGVFCVKLLIFYLAMQGDSGVVPQILMVDAECSRELGKKLERCLYAIRFRDKECLSNRLENLLSFYNRTLERIFMKLDRFNDCFVLNDLRKTRDHNSGSYQ